MGGQTCQYQTIWMSNISGAIIVPSLQQFLDKFFSMHMFLQMFKNICSCLC
jgi:hypothetical protein